MYHNFLKHLLIRPQASKQSINRIQKAMLFLHSIRMDEFLKKLLRDRQGSRSSPSQTSQDKTDNDDAAQSVPDSNKEQVAGTSDHTEAVPVDAIPQRAASSRDSTQKSVTWDANVVSSEKPDSDDIEEVEIQTSRHRRWGSTNSSSCPDASPTVPKRRRSIVGNSSTSITTTTTTTMTSSLHRQDEGEDEDEESETWYSESESDAFANDERKADGE